MAPNRLLHHLLRDSARVYPEAIALKDFTGKSITYRELEHLSDRVARLLRGMGVQRGDRVGMCMAKSIDAIAVIFGILKAGGAYVPVDPSSPSARSAQIFIDCSVRVLVVENRFEASLRESFSALQSSTEGPGRMQDEACNGVMQQWVLPDVGGGESVRYALGEVEQASLDWSSGTMEGEPEDLAYILYTSGSTGRPKGVMLTHRNALSFVDWCTEAFSPEPSDCFSSHAPLHFDLSILDLYVAMKHAARLVLIDDTTGKSPGLLAELISQEKITVWYSTPSVLTLLLQYGKLEQFDLSALRMVLFAGEVFPVKHLRLLQEILPRPRYFNLYGPTETNVCTYFEIPSGIPPDREQAYPIGKVCGHLQGMVVGLDGRKVETGEAGELCIRGPSVTQGYWNLPEQSKRSYLSDDGFSDWYKTGDIVAPLATGDYQFLGRRDRMIKRRGHRVELGEIEAALLRHRSVREAGVVVRDADSAGGVLVAVLAWDDSTRPSVIAMKKYCVEHLPASMIPDQFEFCSSLPKTSTDKIDYQMLSHSRESS